MPGGSPFDSGPRSGSEDQAISFLGGSRGFSSTRVMKNVAGMLPEF